MTRSDFYNLDGPDGERAIARLRELGHRVGLHAVSPDTALDERFDPVVAWHTPDPGYDERAVRAAPSTPTQPPWFDPDCYRSDSNQHWRNGCPHEQLAAGGFEWLQLLIHPGDLGLRGRDDARDDAGADLDADRDESAAA